MCSLLGGVQAPIGALRWPSAFPYCKLVNQVIWQNIAHCPHRVSPRDDAEEECFFLASPFIEPVRRPSLLVGRVVPFAGAVSFTAADAESFLIVRLDFDGAVMVVQFECLRFVGHRVLAAQL